MARPLYLVLLAVVVSPTSARVNSSGAVATFMISECAECTSDRDSIFCTQASSDDNYVANSTTRVTIRQKKREPPLGVGPALGAKYCWEGTFGNLLRNSGKFPEMLNSRNVTVDLSCDQQNLFYRQCVIPAQMAIILMCVGAILCVGGCTCTCFYCGCCKCLNNKNDRSKWGLCNRFCPWMPCSEPPEKEVVLAKTLLNPMTESDHARSLFGRKSVLSSKAPNEAAAGGEAKDGAGAEKAEGAAAEEGASSAVAAKAAASTARSGGGGVFAGFKRPGKGSGIASSAPSVFEQLAEKKRVEEETEAAASGGLGLPVTLAALAALPPPPPPPPGPPPALPEKEEAAGGAAAAPGAGSAAPAADSGSAAAAAGAAPAMDTGSAAPAAGAGSAALVADVGSAAPAAPTPTPAPAPEPEWSAVLDEGSGKTYFVHNVTEAVQWDAPVGFAAPAPPAPPAAAPAPAAIQGIAAAGDAHKHSVGGGSVDASTSAAAVAVVAAEAVIVTSPAAEGAAPPEAPPAEAANIEVVV